MILLPSKNAESSKRLEDLKRFYALLDLLESQVGGTISLSDCSGAMGWPKRGVYFFSEVGEKRSVTGSGSRIVRVGTHALTSGSRATLWKRLSQHKGVVKSGGGNHRGSIFRLLVGTAVMQRHGRSTSTWGKGSTASVDIRANEEPLEREVSTIITNMTFICLPAGDDPGPDSLRGYIEKNSISLLSNYGKIPIDEPSANWLGYDCDRIRVRQSGLWNQNYVADDYEPVFLDTLEKMIRQIAAPK